MKNLPLVVAVALALPGVALAQSPAQPDQLLTHTQIKSTVDQNLGAVKACMKESGGATGRLVVRFGVMPNGHVIDPKPQEHSSNAALDKCIASAFHKFVFAARDGKAPLQGVDYPFTFSAPKPVQLGGEAEMKAINAVIQSHMPVDIKACYNDALKKKDDVAGTVNVEITIAPAGAVSGVKVVDSSTKMPTLDQCILTKVKTWTFAKPEGGVNVTFVYPFVLKLPPKEGDKKDEKK